MLDCVGKLIAFRQERRREADKAVSEQPHQSAGQPEPRFPKPFLWIITAGRPSRVLSLLGAVPAETWPPGVYVSPGKPLDAHRPRPAPPEPGGLLRVGIVVAGELPRDRSTLLVRIMAGGAALPAVLAELVTLPVDTPERAVASTEVLELRRALGSKSDRTVEEEAFIVGTQNILDEIRSEGAAIARARAVLTVLRVRGIAVPEAARERIQNEKDPDRLERWLEKAAVAASVTEVLDEPS
ncbi:MAG: hypothetical protein QM820_41935 [Minicystis sp.]